MFFHVSELGRHCTRVRARAILKSQTSRTAEPIALKAGKYSDWDRLVRWRVSQLGPTLHVRTGRAAVPDLKNA